MSHPRTMSAGVSLSAQLFSVLESYSKKRPHGSKNKNHGVEWPMTVSFRPLGLFTLPSLDT